MKLAEIDGEVRYVKKDGTPSQQEVSDLKKAEFYGFPVDGYRVEVLKGILRTDSVVLAEMGTRKGVGIYLLRKGDQFPVRVLPDYRAFAEQLVENPPPPRTSLQDALQTFAEKRLDAVDMDALAREHGLVVSPARGHGMYWNKDHGEIKSAPEGWTLLQSGDAAWTKAVKKGAHWMLLHRIKVRGKYHYTPFGVLAPASAIEEAFEALGGEEGLAERQAKKMAGVRKRMKNLDERFRAAIQRLYPRIPAKDLDETVRYATRSGAIGRAWELFSSPDTADGDAVFDTAAHLAVRAHVRHRHTRYDEILLERFRGMEVSNEEKAEVRREIADDVDAVLARWR